MHFFLVIAASTLLAAAVFTQPAAATDMVAPAQPAAGTALPGGQDGRIAPYQPRPGRTRPVVAVIGDNAGTELTDFVIPYSVLVRSDAAEVLAVGMRAGSVRMRPALRIQLDATAADFDARYPDGADYVIVPAVAPGGDGGLERWVAAQAAKGATMVSICDGALVLARAGLLKGKRATAHWATHGYRIEHYPDTAWQTNMRYVADGRVVSSAGISAAMPTALALVEAIAGRGRAAALAGEMGVADWSTRHDSEVFRPHAGVNLAAHLTRYTNPWLHSTQQVGVTVSGGIDDIALALAADAWSRTGRSTAVALSGTSEPVRTRDGLLVLPDSYPGGAVQPQRVLAPLAGVVPGKVFDRLLGDIAGAYGTRTAYRVALDFEYPGYHQ